MEVFLVLNDHEIDAAVDEQEQVILAVASGQMSRGELDAWLQKRVTRSGAV
jgi:death-on-curing protein